ncbi:hypothetical protein EDD16DRAFT_757375 [Pisolithus croceorrhizus]|nr:hypothetical protein EDD16DRAFT_757375 [Pisolithus croceorrhizus]
MKTSIYLLSLTASAIGVSLRTLYETGDGQKILPGPFDEVVLNGQAFDASPAARSGFSLDLAERRLVQMEGKAPVWMTELEKIEARANSIRFFDM